MTGAPFARRVGVVRGVWEGPGLGEQRVARWPPRRVFGLRVALVQLGDQGLTPDRLFILLK